MRALLALVLAAAVAVGVAASTASGDQGGQPSTWYAVASADATVELGTPDRILMLHAYRQFNLPGYRAADVSQATIVVSTCLARNTDGDCIYWAGNTGCVPEPATEAALLPNADDFVIDYMNVKSARLTETTFACTGTDGIEHVTATTEWAGSGSMGTAAGTVRSREHQTAIGTVTVDGTAYPFALSTDNGDYLGFASLLYREP